MDASNAVYYRFPNDDNDQGADSKRCSVRGCTQLLNEGSQNKMCDVCRGRHRIYASTKRARRKLEKAAVANAVTARNGHDPLLIHESNMMPVAGPSSWLSVDGQPAHEEVSSPNSQQAPSTTALPSMPSTSLGPTSWSHAIDPRLFSQNGMAPSHHVPPHQTSSSSELANALTLPTPRTPVQPEQIVKRPEDQADQKQEPQAPQPSDQSNFQDLSQNTSGAQTRYCSVKGCKAVIPASYEFKMCPPCRTRYRTYGHTKRAKWKSEREAFDQEMAVLRALEDERRKAKGLGSLADNPEELRAWELSIIDEEIPPSMPTEPPMASLTPPMEAEMNFGQHIASNSLIPSDFNSPMVMAGVYPATLGSIDTPHSISPYPHLSNPQLPSTTGPLPARMCTVSHCHKILPGYYRYKRCEQHRLQNRHHSKLKRVREKEVKAVGPGEDAEALVITDEEIGANEEGSQEQKEPKPKFARQWRPRKERKDKGKPRDVPYPPKVADGTPEMPTNDPDGDAEERTSISVRDDADATQEKTEAKPQEKSQKRARHLCASDNCHNLLVPGVRWRTCEECRNADRKRKFEVRAELKAAEDVYWKGVAVRLSAARRAGEAAGSAAPVASGSGSGSATGVDFPPGMNVDGDADADGDSESNSEDEEERDHHQIPVAKPTPVVSVNTNADTNSTRLPTWSLEKTASADMNKGHVPTFNTLTKEDFEKPATRAGTPGPVLGSGFSKFRVELPPPRPATAQIIEDPLTFKGFKPTTTTAAIGRILASNPRISVDAFTALLEPQNMKVAGTPELANANPQKPGSTSVKSVPTPTIPTSAPFVYKAPVKKVVTPEEKAATSSSSSSTKYKRKAATPKDTDNPTSVISSTTILESASVSALPGPFPPHGYPPSYPYYPYYVPPYPMPPYAYPPPAPSDSSKKGSSQSSASSSNAGPPAMMPNYFPYPYPPQPYGFPPPGGYPYLPPRYAVTTASYGPSSGQQPYPGLPVPGPFHGYPYYPPASGFSVSAPPPGTTTTFTPTVNPHQNPPSLNGGQFSYYRYEEPTAPDQRMKRRKIEPDYIEKSETHTQVISMSLAKDGERQANMSAVPPPVASAIPIAEPTAVVAPLGPPPPTANNEVAMESAMPEPDPSESAQTVVRQCTTKTCNRRISADVAGTICEKCKLRFKKHQAKTKQKFKLEPRKFVLGKSPGGKAEQSQDAMEVELGPS